MNAFAFVLDVLLIVFWGFIFAYVMRLEKMGCECSKDWKRDYIKYYLLVVIPIMVVRLLFTLPQAVAAALGGLTLVFGLTFIFVVFVYIQELRKKKCECSEAPIRNILEVVNYIQIFLVGFALILMLLIALASMFHKPTKVVIVPASKNSKTK